MSCCGINHEEFTQATGLNDGDPVTITYASGEKRVGRVVFGWYGADFDSVSVASGQLHPDGSESRCGVHMETSGWHPFNCISDPASIEHAVRNSRPAIAASYRAMQAIAIEAGGQVWTRAVGERARLQRERSRAQADLYDTPRQVNHLIDRIAALDGELAALEAAS